MKNLIINIFKSSGFEQKSIDNEFIDFYFKNHQEYFLVANYTKEEMIDFFDLPKTNNIIKFYENKLADGNYINSAKNTSLVICTKVNNLQKDMEEVKNYIFRIEEDEYFFKKYVLMYTDDSIINLNLSSNIIEELQIKIVEDSKFDRFQNNLFFSEEYFVVVELFIKLPFLKYRGLKDGYPSLGILIRKNLENKRLIDLNHNLDSYFDQDLSNLKDAFFSDEDSEILDEFFESLGDR